MNNNAFVEPVGPIGVTASQAISALGGSAEWAASYLEWQKEASKRRSIRMPRRQQREVLDMLMAKVSARDYQLLDYHPAGGFFADSFEISIQNKDGFSWRILMYEWYLRIMPENSFTLLWFESLEPRIIGLCFPYSRRLIRIVDCLRSQV